MLFTNSNEPNGLNRHRKSYLSYDLILAPSRVKVLKIIHEIVSMDACWWQTKGDVYCKLIVLEGSKIFSELTDRKKYLRDQGPFKDQTNVWLSKSSCKKEDSRSREWPSQINFLHIVQE